VVNEENQYLCKLSTKDKQYVKWQYRGEISRAVNIIISEYTPEYKFLEFLVGDKQEDEEGLKNLLNTYPDNFELYFQLGKLALSRNDRKQAFEYLMKAKEYRHKILQNIGCIPIHRSYMYEVLMGIVAFYVQQYEIGKLALDRLLFNNLAQKYHNNAYFNYEFYVQPIQTEWTKKYPCSSLILPESIQEYTSLNPSLLPRDDNSFFLNLRIVNWNVNPIGYNQYHSPHPKGKFKTKNLLGVIDHEGNWIQEPQLIQKTKSLEQSIDKLRQSHIDGFEDCRLYHYNKEKQTCSFITNYSKNHPHLATQLSLGKIDVSDTKNPKYTELSPILGYGEKQVQKNWLIYKTEIQDIEEPEEGSSKSPHFAYQENSEAIYFYYPFQRIQISKNGEEFPQSRLIHKHSTEPLNFSAWRGSAGPIPFGNTDMYVMVVHEVYFKEHSGRRYLHRFVFLNQEYDPIGCSHLWYIESKDIEYVSTLQMTKNKSTQEINYLIGYGLCDSCACISSIKHEIIQNMFIPMKNFI
jgi:hypothetical protein